MLSRGVIFTESILLPLIINWVNAGRHFSRSLAAAAADGPNETNISRQRVGRLPYNAIMHALSLGSLYVF